MLPSAMQIRWLALGLMLALSPVGCTTDDDPGLTSTTCSVEDQCQSCATCHDTCMCVGGTPAECAVNCPPAVGETLTCAQGNCAACTECYDTCYCQSGDGAACLSQCGGGTGGAGTGGTGTGGSPAGGSGGVGAVGGSGGGSGGSVATCPTPIQLGNPACEACVNSNCCSQAGACTSGSPCMGLLTCLAQNCANSRNPQACFQAYCGQFANGANAYNALVQCVSSSCQGAC